MIAKGSQQHGPLSLHELQRLASERRLAPRDLTWQQGSAQWIPAEQLGIEFPAAKLAPQNPLTAALRWLQRKLPANRAQLRAASPPQQPLVMALLSGVCLPGLGQLILGQTIKGICWLAAAFGLVAATSGLGLVMWPIAAIDAFMIARRLQLGQPTGDWDFFNSRCG